MGKAVAVDSDDLEVLLFIAGGLTPIERAMAGYNNDFQVGVAKPKLTDVHDRVSGLWRQAIREEDPTADNQLTDGERMQLSEMFPMRGGIIEWSDMPAVRSLRIKKAIEFGNRFIVWPGDSPTPWHHPLGLPSNPCRLTDKGRAALDDVAALEPPAMPEAEPAVATGAESEALDDIAVKIQAKYQQIVAGGRRTALTDGSFRVDVSLAGVDPQRIVLAARSMMEEVCGGKEAVIVPRVPLEWDVAFCLWRAVFHFRYWDRAGSWRNT